MHIMLKVIKMLPKNNLIQQNQLEMVALANFYSKQLIRKMEATLDFSFIYDGEDCVF